MPKSKRILEQLSAMSTSSSDESELGDGIGTPSSTATTTSSNTTKLEIDRNAILEKEYDEERQVSENQEKQEFQRLEKRIEAAYGFVPDLSLSVFCNALNIISNTSCFYYFSSPTHVAFHDLTSGKIVPQIVKQLLGLSRKFIPNKRYSVALGDEDMEKSLNRFERDAHLKAFFSDSPKDSNPPALYVSSKWRPPINTVPQVLLDRLPRFYRGLKKLFVRSRGEPNLLPFQLRLLAWLKKHPDWIVANTDKNLGPCCIERDQYIKDALVHLNNKNIY